MPDTPPLRSGDPRWLGSYELIGRLGEGGQGVVYHGRGPDGADVAVKLLRADLAEDEAARNRFVRELSAAKQVARFCTAQIIEADVAGDHPYIVSELVPGPSLQRQVTEAGPRTGADLERLAIGTVTALAAIHQAGIVHRDFKPHNVLMAPDGPRVIDFGIARALDNSTSVATAAIGTPSYMSPEQVMGQGLTPAVDIFSWASTMVYAATGSAPFGQDNIPAVINRILHQEPALDAMPGDLRELVRHCLAKEPAHRPQAQELLMRLLGQPVPPAQARPGGGDAVGTAVLAQGVNQAGGPTRSGPGRGPGLGGPAAGGLAAAAAQTAAMPGAGSAARTTAMPRTRTNGMPPVLPPSERPAASPGSYDRRGRSGGGAGMFLAALALVVVACLVGFGAWALKHNSGGTGGGGAVPTVTVTDPTTSAPATRPTDVPNPTIGNRTPLRHPPGQVVPSRTRSSHTGPAHTSHPVTTPSGPQTSAPPQTPGPVGTP